MADQGVVREYNLYIEVKRHRNEQTARVQILKDSVGHVKEFILRAMGNY